MERNTIAIGAAYALAMLAAALIAAGCAPDRDPESAVGGGNLNSPEIMLLVPNEGDIDGGESVTIYMTNFKDDFTVNPPLVYFGADQTVVFPVVSIHGFPVESRGHTL